LIYIWIKIDRHYWFDLT